MRNMIQLLVASRNRHKIQEIRQILGDEIPVWSLDHMVTAPVLVEDADTFHGNAERKASQLADRLRAVPEQLPAWDQRSPLIVLADDSGLEVVALNGAPGVLSARFANPANATGGNACDSSNNDRLLRLLAGVPVEQRQARFRCVLAVIELRPDMAPPASGIPRIRTSHARCFEGVCHGVIGFEPRGHDGFGYDPLFLPDGHTRTFAELGEETKNRLSHRFQALDQFRKWLITRSPGSGRPDPAATHTNAATECVNEDNGRWTGDRRRT